MKIRGGSYFLIVIMVIALTVIGSSLAMEYFKSKFLPLLISSIVFVLTSIALRKEISARNGPETTATEGQVSKGGKRGGVWRGYLITGAWIVGFFLTIYLLGFTIAIALFLLTYLKSHGIKWLTTIIVTVLTPALIYVTFGILLRLDLNQGLLISW